MIEYLNYYLPYKLKVQMPDGNIEIPCGYLEDDFIFKYNTYNKHGDNDYSTDPKCPIFMTKPILRPHSYLIKEIDIQCPECIRIPVDFHECDTCSGNGLKIVPGIEIARLAHGLHRSDGFINTYIDTFKSVNIEHDSLTGVVIDTDYNISAEGGYSFYVDNQIKIFQFLLTYHFDIWNLIEQGKAIAYEE